MRITSGRARQVIIKIDTPEQFPYAFSVPTEVGTLPVGDYSISGLEDCVAVERKSLDDLIGCLTGGRVRFERELYRGRTLEYFALVIEANLEDIALGRYRSAMLPQAAVQSVLAFSVRYHLPVFFAGRRDCAARVTQSLLEKYAAGAEKKFKAVEERGVDKI
jgi:ERCC4-type nuclease